MRGFELIAPRGKSGCHRLGGARCQSGQNKSYQGDKRPVGRVATRHRAGGQATHVVSTVHSIIGSSRRFAMVMFGDWAVVSGAASHPARGPGGSGEWSVQKQDREQAEASGKNGPAVLRMNSHCVRSLVRHTTPKYSVVHRIWRTCEPKHHERGNIACSDAPQYAPRALT